MEVNEIKSLTNKQIKEHQQKIQSQLTIDIPIIKDLQKRLVKLKTSVYQQQSDYQELDKELYLRTRDIIKIAPLKKKKRTSKKNPNKIIDKLVKELGNEKIKEMLAQLNQSKERNI